MKKLVFVSRLVIVCLVLLASWASCRKQEAPDFDTKDLDVRLLGKWRLEKFDKQKNAPEQEYIEFLKDRTYKGRFFPGGGKRLFYTEDNNRLLIFVYSKNMKINNWTYISYYNLSSV